jgi:hypothetical protein
MLQIQTRRKPQTAQVGEIEHTWPTLWALCCLIGGLVPVGLAVVGHLPGERAAMGVLALVAVGIVPMAMIVWAPKGRLSRLLKAGSVVGLFGAGLWLSLCSVGVMSAERGVALSSGIRQEGVQFLNGLNHFYPQPESPEPRWIRPGSQPFDIPLDALREELHRKGRLND